MTGDVGRRRAGDYRRKQASAAVSACKRLQWRPIDHPLRSLLALAAVALAGCGGEPAATHPMRCSATGEPPEHRRRARVTPLAMLPKPVRYAVGLRVITIVDRTRTITLPGGTVVPRRLVTYVRYPALGPPTAVDRLGAPAAIADGPFPLVIFGHGFAVTPAPYAPLLRAWVQAGYVVAAPVFPLENGDAPGGPNEADLVNQPRDMSVVISALQAGSAHAGPLQGLIDPHAVAVAGQSDGGETALAVAYDRFDRDLRVRAAVILSGAKIPGLGGFQFPVGSPPLLATDGTADTINPPSFTHAFFDVAPPPKYLLNLLGASHLPPYTTEQPQLEIVARVVIDFLNRYLKHRHAAAAALGRDGNDPGIAMLQADP